MDMTLAEALQRFADRTAPRNGLREARVAAEIVFAALNRLVNDLDESSGMGDMERDWLVCGCFGTLQERRSVPEDLDDDEATAILRDALRSSALDQTREVGEPKGLDYPQSDDTVPTRERTAAAEPASPQHDGPQLLRALCDDYLRQREKDTTPDALQVERDIIDAHFDFLYGGHDFRTWCDARVATGIPPVTVQREIARFRAGFERYLRTLANTDTPHRALWFARHFLDQVRAQPLHNPANRSAPK